MLAGGVESGGRGSGGAEVGARAELAGQPHGTVKPRWRDLLLGDNCVLGTLCSDGRMLTPQHFHKK